MGKVYKQGIVSPKGFDLVGPEPTDQREIVEVRGDLLTLTNCYPGIEVKIKNEAYKEFKLIQLPSSDANNWIEVGVVAPGQVGAVTSVNGKAGTVVLVTDDISAASSFNKYTTASDIAKLAGIESFAQVNTVNSVNGKTGTLSITKTDLSIQNVDNTSDVNKPISTAVGTALALKRNIFDEALVKTANYNTSNNNAEADKLLIFNALAGPYTITLNATGLTVGFEQQIFNNSGQNIIINSSATLLGENIPLAHGFFAYYKLASPGVWTLAVGGIGPNALNSYVGNYVYQEFTRLQDTVNDTRYISSGGVVTLQKCTVGNAVKGAGTWVTTTTY